MKILKSIGYLSLIVAVSVSCQQEEVEPNEPVTNSGNSGGGTTSSPYFINYTSGGQENNVSENQNSGFTSSSSNGASIDSQNDQIEVNLNKGFYNISGGNSVSITFNENNFQMTTYGGDKPAALETIFSVGEHPLVGATSSSPFVSFELNDGNMFWTSKEVIQGNDASFTVTSSVASLTNSLTAARTVEGTFNNLTIKSESGTTQTITNGSFKLQFEAY